MREKANDEVMQIPTTHILRRSRLCSSRMSSASKKEVELLRDELHGMQSHVLGSEALACNLLFLQQHILRMQHINKRILPTQNH